MASFLAPNPKSNPMLNGLVEYRGFYSGMVQASIERTFRFETHENPKFLRITEVEGSASRDVANVESETRSDPEFAAA